MNSKMLFSLFFMLLISVVAAVIPAPPVIPGSPDSPSTDPDNDDDNGDQTPGSGGSITGFIFESVPRGVSVYLDGAYKGETRRVIVGLRAGQDYEIIYEKEGYVPQSVTKTAEPNRLLLVNLTLSTEQPEQFAPPAAQPPVQSPGQNQPADTPPVTESNPTWAVFLWIVLGMVLIGGLAVFLIVGKKTSTAQVPMHPLHHYIQSSLSSGYDPMRIKNALLQTGWQPQQIDSAFRQIYGGR